MPAIRILKVIAFISLLLGLAPLSALAQSSMLAVNSEIQSANYYPGILVSQFEGDDAYDPFADYSEFEESAEEEADINFFRNGRFFTMGFIGGYRTFTESLGDLYSDAPTFGLFLSYFFDLRFALQLQFLTGDHKFSFDAAGQNYRGNVSLTNIGINLKYYINTQNVSRGVAKFNPYIVGGFSQVYRTTTATGSDAFGKEGALGFDIGGGIEVPILRNKMFLGAQANYQLVSFKDENSEIINSSTGDRTGVYPKGDIIYLLGILGINF